MSHDPVEPREGDHPDAATLLAQAAAAEARARAMRDAAIGDFALPDAARLDDRTRVALRTLLRAILGTIGGDLHGHATRLLRERGEAAAAAALAGVEPGDIFARAEAIVLADGEVAAELLDRVAMDLLAERLPGGEGGEGASVLVGYLANRDRVVAQRAAALMAAESRRRAPVDQPPYATDLPAEVHVAFVWATAAAIAAAAEGGAAIDRALADAALRSLAAHDEGERLEAAAVRLAAALDPARDALGPLLEAALADRRVALFVALVAHGLHIAFDDARALLAGVDDPRWWLALRALAIERTVIARIAYLLSEADPRRDIERFADRLPEVMAVAPAAAEAALAALRLPRAYRDMRAAMASGGG